MLKEAGLVAITVAGLVTKLSALSGRFGRRQNESSLVQVLN
jgi:hypothetical protein